MRGSEQFAEFAERSLFDGVQPDEVEVPDDEPDMNGEDALDDESEDALGDFGDLVPGLFKIWFIGSEYRWAEYAWSALSRAGLTDHEDEVERTLVVSRLLVLAALNIEFAARAFGQGPEGDWQYAIWDVEGEDPGIDPICLGRLVERECIWVEDEDRPSSGQLLRELVRAQWGVVVRALAADLGDNELFASLVTSRESDATYPTPKGRAWEVQSTDLSEGSLHARAWISDGMPLW